MVLCVVAAGACVGLGRLMRSTTCRYSAWRSPTSKCPNTGGHILTRTDHLFMLHTAMMLLLCIMNDAHGEQCTGKSIECTRVTAMVVHVCNRTLATSLWSLSFVVQMIVEASLLSV